MASPQRKQPKRRAQPFPKVSKALRTLSVSEDIQGTQSLIQAYNANHATDSMGVALHQWLETYVHEFSKYKAKSLPESWVREYALLAMIDVKSSAAEELVGRVYVSLRDCIKTGEQCSPVIVVALDNMLRVMDTKIVEKQTQSLNSLAYDLLRLTDPEQSTFTRDTYAFHMACLHALERILIVLHGVERASSRQWVVNFFRQKLKIHLKAIEAKQKYYPFVYNTQLIKYNINGLIENDTTSLLLNAGRRAFYALYGGLHLFQGIRELAVMRIDFAAIEAGALKMQKAFSGTVDTKTPGLRRVIQAASKAEETQDFSHVMKCYKKHERPSFINRMLPKQTKIVKFALVSHLTLFAKESPSTDLSNQAFRLLSKLAVNDDTAQWRKRKDIFECLLDALASVGSDIQPLRQRCLQLLHQMESNLTGKHQTVLRNWRGGKSIEEKLDMKNIGEFEILLPSLYDIVREQLKLHLTHTSSLEHKQELIEHYQNKSFAMVPLLLNEVKKRHIKDFDFHIVVLELVDVMNQDPINASLTGDDQLAHNMERCNWTQKPIKLQDIFAPRCQKLSGPKEEVTRVLLLGNPGTGKTSLSKKLCHDWAIGEWGLGFERVYLLPIRQLAQSRLQLEKTLEDVIAVMLFKANYKSKQEQTSLQRQIKDELDERTTLLVLDGLDEANGNDKVEEIVGDAVARSCCILTLSRPHNLGDVRWKMDIQVECLGLNDDQLETYMHREAPDTSDELIQFLNKSPVVWETAKVPVNAQILCTLWNSEKRQGLKELQSLSLKSLYSSMSDYVWQRFVEKTGANVDRQAVFSSLETIAFKSIIQGKVEIPLDLVIKHAQGSTTLKLFRDSGFLLFYKEGQVFQFAHLSFHEFFAGRFLAKSLRSTAKEIKKAKKYVAEHKYYDTSRVTLSFMTQCYCQEEEDDENEDCIESLKELLSILDDKPVEVVGFQHILLKMRTLDAFFSVCGSCVEDIRSHDDLQGLIQSAITALKKCVKAQSRPVGGVNICSSHPALYDQIVEDLGQMPNLFACLPEFLAAVLINCDTTFSCVDTRKVGRLVSYASETLLQIVPKELRNVENNNLEDGYNIGLELWFELFAESGPESAFLALDQLKTACQSKRRSIRTIAYAAAIRFLKVLPNQKAIHSLCMNATKDPSGEVRQLFMNNLRHTKFAPNSSAANLAWTLTVEATRDNDERVRSEAYQSVVRQDQNSESSIDEMIEELLENIPMCVGDTYTNNRCWILRHIRELLRRFPTKLAVFLPYLAICCNDPTDHIRSLVVDITQKLASSFPTLQRRELGEMISKIYCNVEDPVVRKWSVTVLNDIRQKIPEFMIYFPDVFSQGCTDTDSNVGESARGQTAIASNENVDTINKVFWDQSFRVKKELLVHIWRKSMINAETAETVLEMVANCMESDSNEIRLLSLCALVFLTKFHSVRSMALYRLLDIKGGSDFINAVEIVFKQPLAVLLKYFRDTTDERVMRLIAEKHMLASVTYQTAISGKTIVSVVERGKETQLEVPTEWAENLNSIVKLKLHEIFGDCFP